MLATGDGVVDEPVDAAEPLDHAVDHGPDGVGAADVALEGGDVAARSGEPLNGGVGTVGVLMVDDRDAGAVVSELLGDAGADASAAAGDDRNLSLK